MVVLESAGRAPGWTREGTGHRTATFPTAIRERRFREEPCSLRDRQALADALGEGGILIGGTGAGVHPGHAPGLREGPRRVRPARLLAGVRGGTRQPHPP